MPKDIIIQVDTREQTPWLFEKEEKVKSGYKSRIIGSEVKSFDAGDYGIIGYEDQLRIERKNGFGELFGNMLPKEHKERFEREMEKLRNISHKYILIETNISKDSLAFGVPQIKFGPTCNKILKWLIELQMEYGIQFLFVGDAGQKVARNIFEEFIKRYT